MLWHAGSSIPRKAGFAGQCNLAAEVGQNQNQSRNSEVERLGSRGESGGGGGGSKEGNTLEVEEEDDMSWWWCVSKFEIDFGIDVKVDIVSVFLKKGMIAICRMFKKLTMAHFWRKV